jgi:hypothetical protein
MFVCFVCLSPRWSLQVCFYRLLVVYALGGVYKFLLVIIVLFWSRKWVIIRKKVIECRITRGKRNAWRHMYGWVINMFIYF